MSTPTEKGYFLELNEHFLLAARTSSLVGPRVIEDLREAPFENESAVGQLLGTVFPETRKGMAPAVCAVRPRHRLFHLAGDSEIRQYPSPAALRAFVSHSGQAGAGDSAIVALHTGSGLPLGGSGLVEGHWVFEGSSRNCLDAMLATVRGWKLAPRRIEAATLAMFGAIVAELQANKTPSQVLVWEISQITSDLFLLGSDGLVAAKRLPFGFERVAESIQSEIHLKSLESAAKMFFNEFCDFSEIGSKIASQISPSMRPEVAELVPDAAKASVSLFCSGLPSKQAWFNDHLARSLGLAPWRPDAVGWCRRAGLGFVGNTLQASLSPTWLGLLGVMSAFQADKPDAESAWHLIWNCDGQIPDTSGQQGVDVAPPPKPEPVPTPAIPETVEATPSKPTLPAEKAVTAATKPPPQTGAAPSSPPPTAVTPPRRTPSTDHKPAILDAGPATAASAQVRNAPIAPPPLPPAAAAPAKGPSAAAVTVPNKPANRDDSAKSGTPPAPPAPTPTRPITSAPSAAPDIPKKADAGTSVSATLSRTKTRAPAAASAAEKPAKARKTATAESPPATATPAPEPPSAIRPDAPKASAPAPVTPKPDAKSPPPPAAAPVKVPATAAAGAPVPPATAARPLADVPEKKDRSPEKPSAPAAKTTSRRLPRTPIPETADHGESLARRRPFPATPAGIAVMASVALMLGAAVYFYLQFSEQKAAALHAQAVAEQHAAAEAAARQQAEQQAKAEAEARRRAEVEIAQTNAAAEAARQKAAEEARQREIETNRLLNGRGSLTIATDPPGATIEISNLAPRQSPATITDLRLGHYAVKVSLADYEPASLDVEIKDGETTAAGPIHLVRQTGSLMLSTQPAGVGFEVRPAAARFVPADDLHQGKTPATLADLPTGKYTVTFTRDGWPSHTEDVAIESHGTAQASSDFPGGSVTITSTPAGATVKRNGLPAGVTPLKLQDQVPGEASFTLEQDGFIPADVAGRIEPEKTLLLDATLISADRIAAITELDERPVPIKTVKPSINLYPGQSDTEVSILLTIDRDGTPTDLKVESAPNELMGRSCLDAAAQWRFNPGRIRGVPVKTRVSLPFKITPPDPLRDSP